MSDWLFSISELINFGTIGYIASALIAYISYSRIIYPYYFGPLRNLPRGKNAFLHYINYNYDYITGDPAKHLKLIQKCGPVVYASAKLVITSDTNARKQLLSYKFPKAKNYSLFNINGPNLFSSTEKEFHIRRKKLISPAFNNKLLAALEPTIYRVGSESLVQYLNSHLDNDPDHEFDLYRLFNCNTFDVITELVFGKNYNTTWDEKEGLYYTDKVVKSAFALFKRVTFPFHSNTEVPMEIAFKPIILENINKRKQSNEFHNDILQSMIDAEDPDTGAKLADLEIVDECLILLLAGMDTTANTLTWTLYELLKHPEYFELVVEEIINHFPNLNEPISIDKAKRELKYLEAAIYESIRMHPGAAGSLPREVPEGGITVCGHYIPAKTSIAIDIYTEHYDPSYWKDPREFNLNRWLGGDREANIAKFAGFGIGTRSCIGRDLAWSELYLVLANLIRTFNIELVDEVLTPVYKFIYRPKERRFRVKLSRRS